MTWLTKILVAGAIISFVGAVVSRLGAPRLYLGFTLNQFFDLADVFVMAAILTTLLEYTSRKEE